MYHLLTAMTLVFVVMLTAAPIRLIVPPEWEWRVIRTRWVFAQACWILFTFEQANIGTMFLSWIAVLGAYLVGFLASMGLVRLWLGHLPQTRQLEKKDDYRFDPLYDWSHEAVQHKIKQFWLPALAGIVAAFVAYKALA